MLHHRHFGPDHTELARNAGLGYPVRKLEPGYLFQNPKDAIALGKRIRTLRLEKGMSQTELAFETDKDRSTIVRVESAKMNITIDLLFSIAKALKVHPRELFNY